MSRTSALGRPLVIVTTSGKVRYRVYGCANTPPRRWALSYVRRTVALRGPRRARTEPPGRADRSGDIGDGSNSWPAVHCLDATHLFRLTLEKAPAGSTLHALADEGVPICAIVQVIGRHLDLPVVAVSPADAGEHFA